MSEPTYRIETEYDSTEESLKWTVRVFLIRTGKQVKTFYGSDDEAQVERAQKWIAAQFDIPPQGRTLYATEDGEIVPAPEPQSLRA